MTSLTVKEKLGYGLGDTASNFVWAMVMNFIMFYYTDIFGITAAAAGTMLLFARVFDGATDFMMGAIADRTQTRWGKFRPYLLWMSLPLAVVFVMAFSVPNLGVTGKIIYAWITYNLLMLLYTAINIPYGALSGVMTDDPLDRTSLNSYRMGLAQIGGIIANTSFLWLVARFGQGNDAAGAQRTVMLFSFIAIALFLVSFLTTRERIQPPPAQRTRLLDDLQTLAANPHWIVMFAGALINITFAVVRGTAGIYYLKSYLRWNESWIATYFLVGGLSMILGAMLTRPVVKVMGKKYAFIASMAMCALTAAPFYWIGAGQTAMVFTFQILGMIAAGVNATLFWAMIADTADYSEWRFGVRTTGIVFSATTCAQKVGMGVGAAFAGYLLSYFGYVANAVQTERSIHGIVLLFSLIPAAGQIVLAIAFNLYGLNENVCRTMNEELAQRRSTFAASSEPLPAGA